MGIAEDMAAKLRESAAAEQANAAPKEDAPPPPKARARRTATDISGWTGAQPKAKLTRTPLNVGMPDVLRIHERLALLTARERITAQDAVAEAIDQWLTEKGIPRDAK